MHVGTQGQPRPPKNGQGQRKHAYSISQEGFAPMQMVMATTSLVLALIVAKLRGMQASGLFECQVLFSVFSAKGDQV